MPDQATIASATSDIATSINNASSGVRDTAKWLAGGLAAIGAVFAAGAQLTSIGSLTELWRLAIAAGAILAGLVGIGYALIRTIDLLLPQQLGLTTIGRLPANDPVRAFLETNAVELLEGEATTIDGENGFIAVYERAIRERAEAFRTYRDDPNNPKSRDEAQNLDARAAYLNALAQKVTAEATYERLRGRIPGWRRGLLVGGFIVALAITAFAWAANPPESSAPTVDLRGAVLTDANLHGAILVGADMTGANLSGAILTNAKLDDATLDRVVWSHTTCPDGTNSDDVGGTCTGHLN